MAASSPAMSGVPAAETTAVSTLNPLSSHNSKNLRGLNKPKCIKCGNVARSRCPYQSCKSCCAKAQNPCHIHVLKGNSSFPDKVSTSGSPLLDQQSTEVSHSGSSHRLRQLSNNFAQFSNLQTPFRSRKPLSRKDAQIINEWRFIKLKEFKDRNIDTENEAFDRYMQNAYLLGEVFMVNDEYVEQFQGEQTSDRNPNPKENSEENTERIVNGLKLKLRSNSVRTENFRKRIHRIVDQELSKLRKVELNEGGDNTSDIEGNETTPKKVKSWQDERTFASNDLIEKMNQAQNKDDLKACQDMASQIFGPSGRSKQTETSDDDFLQSLEQEDKPDLSRDYSLPKWITTVDIDQESLCQIDEQFSALEEIENL